MTMTWFSELIKHLSRGDVRSDDCLSCATVLLSMSHVIREPPIESLVLLIDTINCQWSSLNGDDGCTTVFDRLCMVLVKICHFSPESSSIKTSLVTSTKQLIKDIGISMLKSGCHSIIDAVFETSPQPRRQICEIIEHLRSTMHSEREIITFITLLGHVASAIGSRLTESAARKLMHTGGSTASVDQFDYMAMRSLKDEHKKWLSGVVQSAVDPSTSYIGR